MFAKTTRTGLAGLLWMFVLTMGCATTRGASSPSLADESRNVSGTAQTGHRESVQLQRRRGECALGTRWAMAGPAELAARAVASSAVQVDAFESLLHLAGLDNSNDLRPRGAALSSEDALRMLGLLLNKPVTLGSFPPRMAVYHLLREVLAGEAVSRAELLRRVERFKRVAVLRPDGYLAWALNGHTQQRVGPVEWRVDAFRAGPFELGRFYTVNGWVFRHSDTQLGPIMDGPGLAEVYDDADYISRSLDGAQEAFVDLYHAMGQLLSHPWSSLAELRYLPTGIVVLLASSPAYLERFRYLTRGEQVRVLAKLTTHLILTVGTAASATNTLTWTVRGAEATVPALSLSAEGVLAVERIVVPAGQVAMVMRGGPGAALVLQRANANGHPPAPPPGPGRWGPAEESMSARARAYQEQVSGHSADEAYWVGAVGNKGGGVKFDGFKDGVLLEAKGPGFANKFLDTLEPAPWFEHSGAKALVGQAKRQLKAASNTGTPIRWHVAEEKVADAIRLLLKTERVYGIEVVHTPML